MTMTTDPKPGLDPVEICTLPEDGLAERLVWIRDEILPHALATERLDRGLAYEFLTDPKLEAKLDQWIELERECCSSLTLERSESRIPGRSRLEIRGINPDAEVFESLRVSEPAQEGRGGRLAKAAAAGLAGSLFVCCILPMAAGAALGAAAAPLAGLDAPIPIAFAAVLGGFVTWRWQSRKAAANSTCGPDC